MPLATLVWVVVVVSSALSAILSRSLFGVPLASSRLVDVVLLASASVMFRVLVQVRIVGVSEVEAQIPSARGVVVVVALTAVAPLVGSVVV